MTTRERISLLRSEWLGALRSGRYQQGKDFLITQRGDPIAKPTNKRPEGHCVLGVMCEVFFAHNPDWRWADPDAYMQATRSFELTHRVLPNTSMPPGIILEAFGVPRGFAHDIARMNDGGYSFMRLADHLEAVWAREPIPEGPIPQT